MAMPPMPTRMMSVGQQIFGAKGPEDMLVPHAPLLRLHSEKSVQEDLESELFPPGNEERLALKEESDEEFSRAAGGLTKLMDRELFVETAGQLWKLDRVSAKACFRAGDADQSGRINRLEWLILREAFVHRSEEHAQNAAIRDLQLRAALHSHDADRDGHLSAQELAHWLRELTSGDAHVNRLAESLISSLEESQGPPPSPRTMEAIAEEESVKFKRWNSNENKGEAASGPAIERIAAALETGGPLSPWLAANSLSADDMITQFVSSHRFGRRMRVVYDGRAESARCAALEGSVVRGNELAQLPKGSPALTGLVSTNGVPGYAVSEGLTMLPSLRAIGGWRGAIGVQRSSSAFFLCQHVIDTAARLAHEARSAADMPGDEWMPEGALLAELCGKDMAAQADAIVMLANECRRVLAVQPTVVRVRAPAKVFGDVHGQLRDLLLLFGWYGFPTHKGGDIQTCSYVFNGDWVDRGPHQLETVILLFALKAMFPASHHITLLRGNHEFRHMSESMGDAGFKAAVKKHFPNPKHGPRVYDACHKAFDWLPIAALVSESVLVLHGGVGDGSWSLADLARVPRPLEDEHEHTCTLHALWSDPSDSDVAMRSGVHASKRGSDIPEFGPDVTEKFCADNNVSLVIRAHQYCRQGYKVMHSGRLMTVFSARNYFQAGEGKANDAAMLLLAQDGNEHLRVHPKRLEQRREPQAVVKGQQGVTSPDDWRVRLLGSLARCMQV